MFVSRVRTFLAVFALLVSAQTVVAQGLILPGTGAVNRSMGGASTAAPIDPAGAGYWNPAAIRGLPGNAVSFGAELLYADVHLTSSVPLGVGAGTTYSNSGLPSLPTIALVYHPDDSLVTFGMGIHALMGGAANYAGSSTNPVLSPNNPPASRGFGPIASSASALQIAPIMAVQLTERLTFGLGPTINSMAMTLDPAFFAGRNDANGDGVSTFPAATHGRPYWGGGYQLGLYYELNPCWSFGFGYKSEQWFETLKWNSSDEIGRAMELRLDLTLPQIYSLGMAYKGIDRLLVAVDVRYLDYENTTLFGQRILDGGLAWDSVFSVACGTQYQLTNSLSARFGYQFNENPIPGAATLFNVQLPVIAQHSLSVGSSLDLNRNLRLSAVAMYAFRSRVQGSVAELTNATVAMSMDVFSLGFQLGVWF